MYRVLDYVSNSANFESFQKNNSTNCLGGAVMTWKYVRPGEGVP